MSIKINNYLNSYEFACELPSDGRTISFKPFTTGQMKKMMTYESSEDPFIIEKILDDIITECVVTEGFSINDLLLQDRFYLLLKLREKSKGDKYNYHYKCSSCGTSTPGNIKISEMAVKPMVLDDTPIALNDQLSVKMKLITRGEQRDIYNRVNNGKFKHEEKIVEVVTMSVAQSMNVFYADGEEDAEVPFEDKLDLVNNGIPTSGFELLKDWLISNDFGIEFKVNVSCMKCHKKDIYDIPVDNFFD